jgi:DNA-binding transcriptional ArsR family regulator
MQVSIQLTPADLDRLRFGYSPLLEMTSSLKALYSPPHAAYFRAWVQETLCSVHREEFTYLRALHNPRGYSADFITPSPADGINTLDAELVRLRNQPAALIRANVETMIRYYGSSSVLEHFMRAPHEALECLIEDILRYWQIAFEPRWSQIRSVLENDMLYHARQMALNGTEHMLNSLSNALEYGGQRIEITKERAAQNGEKVDFTLNGEGLYLTPALFHLPDSLSWQITPEWEPMLIYSARGAGGWYTPQMPDPIEDLELALGATRAQVLLALRDPEHTVGLARMLHLTESAVSQHLKRLTSAGLVDSRRSGHHVYYRLSERGSSLINLFASV